MNTTIPQYQMFPPVIAVDFDNTLFFTEYPKIISPNLPIIKKCKELKKKGYIITLWTCRNGQELQDAINICLEYGLVFDYINDNEVDRVAYYGSTRKVSADYYLDDRSISFDSFLKL